MLKNTPHISNINQDPLMTGRIKKALKDGVNTIGRETADSTPDILIDGLGISDNHCTIHYDSNSRTAEVHPNKVDPKKFKILVNGKLIEVA